MGILLGFGDIDKEKLARLLLKDVLDMDDIYNTIFVGSSKDKKDDEESSDANDGGGNVS